MVRVCQRDGRAGPVSRGHVNVRLAAVNVVGLMGLVNVTRSYCPVPGSHSWRSGDREDLGRGLDHEGGRRAAGARDVVGVRDAGGVDRQHVRVGLSRRYRRRRVVVQAVDLEVMLSVVVIVTKVGSSVTGRTRFASGPSQRS